MELTQKHTPLHRTRIAPSILRRTSGRSLLLPRTLFIDQAEDGMGMGMGDHAVIDVPDGLLVAAEKGDSEASGSSKQYEALQDSSALNRENRRRNGPYRLRQIRRNDYCPPSSGHPTSAANWC